MYFAFYFIFLIFYSVFFYSPNQGNSYNFPFREYTIQKLQQHVGAGIGTLMSISNGLGPSIFCRKMEKTRPMMEGMDGKVFYFPPESAFLLLMLYF